MAQLDGFTAAAYDPEGWAALFARAGARYAVLTARHHDGVALWDTAYGNLDVVRNTPAGRELLGGYADALRGRGLRVGLYYSHSDWSHPDYASVVHPEPPNEDVATHPLVVPEGGVEDPAAWARYLAYRDGQVGELVDRFRPDLLWFDGEWERAEEQWGLGALAARILESNPDTVLNARMLSHGDYATPEQGVPLLPPDGPSTLSADRRTLYLVCFDPPREAVSVRGLRTAVKRVRVVGTGAEPAHRITGGLHDVPGVLWIDAPAPADTDPRATVLAVELDGELELYRGTGRS